MIHRSFPFKLASDGAGTVVAVGTGVTRFRAGDQVYGTHFSRPITLSPMGGFASEYTVGTESLLLAKPPHVSFEDAASLLASAVTAYQSFTLGAALLGTTASSSLAGKTVFVPGALSATGSVGCQMAKNVFGAARVISTVSTAKVPLVERHLPAGVVDQVIDYKTQDVVAAAGGRGSVDLVYNTQWDLGSRFALLKPRAGALVSIASIPPAGLIRLVMGADAVPSWTAWILDLAQVYYWWRLPAGVPMEFVSGNPGERDDLEAAGEMIATGKIKAVTTAVRLDDLDAVRRESELVRTGKGGLGKLVFTIL